MSRPDRLTFQKRLDNMLSELREDIASGVRQTGDLLPSELELAKRYQLSRNSIRVALETLQQERYIKKVPNVGNKVLAIERPEIVNVKLGVYKSVLQDMSLMKLIDEYHTWNPLVRIQLVMLPNDDYCDTVQTYMRNEMLDLLTLNYTNFLMFQEADKLDELFQPLDPAADTYPFLTDPYRTGERVWVQPLLFSPVILCYNKSHFAAAGLPEPDSSWKWDDLKQAAHTLSGDGERYGFYFFLLSENRWSIFLLQNGVRIERDEAGTLQLDQPEFRRTLEFTRELLHYQTDKPVFLLDSENDAELLFKQEKASMIMTTYFNLNYLNDCTFPFDIAPLPSSGQFKTLLLNIGAAINKHSKVKEEAIAFVNFLAGASGQTIIRQHTHSLPSSRNAAEREVTEQALPSEHSLTRFKMFREIIPTFEYYSVLQIKPFEFHLLRKELKLYWAKWETLEQFIQRMKTIL